MPDRFRQRLQREFDARREKNARFSLRAFAKLLGTEHATISQILNGQRRAPVGRIRVWAKQLGMDPEESAAYIAAEHLPDEATAARQEQVRHWTAEAAAILSGRVHWEIFRLSGAPEFRADVRWVSREIGATADEVNVAFARLLRLGLMETAPDARWVATAKGANEREFRRTALKRVRTKAAEMHVKLPRGLER
jgi:transcriptional regulator with XRE-family HTH domain